MKKVKYKKMYLLQINKGRKWEYALDGSTDRPHRMETKTEVNHHMKYFKEDDPKVKFKVEVIQVPQI